MYQHNHSILLGSKRQSVYYHPTGSGRDTYIINNNGGTNIKNTYQGIPELGNYMKFGPYNRTYKPRSYTRFQKYASDGTGRDKYVVSKHGGQYLEDDEMNAKLIKFRNTMRDGGQWRNTNTKLNQSWRSQSTLKKDDIFRRTQRSNSNRLSAPKRVTQKYEDQLEKLRTQFLTPLRKSSILDINNEEDL